MPLKGSSGEHGGWIKVQMPCTRISFDVAVAVVTMEPDHVGSINGATLKVLLMKAAKASDIPCFVDEQLVCQVRFCS